MENGYEILAIIPPLVAILLSFKTKAVLPSLFAGIFVGSIIIVGGNVFSGTAYAMDIIIESVTDPWNARLLLFTFFMGVGISFIWRLGGSFALAAWAKKNFKSRRSVCLGTWILGMLTSVNDVLVAAVDGNVFRDISKEYRISSEKFSYVLDSTAAPAAAIFISDWIAYQIGMVNKGLEVANITDIQPVAAYVKSIPFNLYSIFTLIFVGIIMFTGKDYGPMLKAESRALKTGQYVDINSTPMMDINSELGEPKQTRPMIISFILPILSAFFVILFGLYWTGRAGSGIMGILENAEADKALLWGALSMAMSGVILALVTKIMNFKETMDTFIDGLKLMVLTASILIMAWSLGSVTQEMGLANYIMSKIGTEVHFGFFPIIIFILSMIIAFATGTSWGTMAIMTPLAIPLAYNITGDVNASVAMAGVVLSGAIFGDHCSPISDTTVMASIFSGADHIDHVKTQFPYAITVASVICVMYALFGFFNITPIILIPLGLVILIAIHRILHKYYINKYGITEDYHMFMKNDFSEKEKTI